MPLTSTSRSRQETAENAAERRDQPGETWEDKMRNRCDSV